jgi:C-terminal processing protease CtpA/Prc
MAELNAKTYDWASSQALPAFLRDIVPLSQEERRAIIAGATILLRCYYVHLPDKCREYAIDPLGALARLENELPPDGDDVAFHTALCGIFAELRDLHTQYVLPAAYHDTACLLPFKMEACWERGQTRYLVTSLQPSYEPPLENDDFAVGAEILTWCGLPIAAAVAAAAARSAGANEGARAARGLASMTIRPLERQPPPDESMITLTYAAPYTHEISSLTLQWRVITQAAEHSSPALSRFVGIDHEGEARRRAYTRAYHPRVREAALRALRGERVAPYPEKPALPTCFPSIFKAHRVPESPYGYIRIFSFAPPTTEQTIEALLRAFTREFVRLIQLLPPGGLVIDVRGNGGGYMPLAESLLQVLAPGLITPEPVEFLANLDVLGLCCQSSDFAVFIPSVERQIAQGGGQLAGYSDGFPLTEPRWCNWHERNYFGPVVLLIDALCYSATDAFAAGFQDHQIGRIIGVSSSTGAGGGNVWQLPDFLDVPVDTLSALPKQASLRVALRRTRRVGPNAGALVEGAGVIPDITHTVTRDDLLHADRDLLACAAQVLTKLASDDAGFAT